MTEEGWGPGIGPLLEHVDQAHVWLRSFGLEPDRTRFGRYAGALRRARHHALEDLPEEEGRLAREAIVPYLEMLAIREHLAPMVDSDRLASRLKRLLAGPALETDESTKTATNAARNTGFELAVAAQLARVGARVILPDDGDLTADFDHAIAAIECKRVQSIAGVRGCIRDGGAQLAARHGLPPDALRFVAIDLSLVVRSRSSLFVYPTHEAALGVLRARLTEIHSAVFEISRRVQGRGTLGLLSYAVAPVYVSETGFWGRAEHPRVTIGPRRPSAEVLAAFERFRPALVRPAEIHRPR